MILDTVSLNARQSSPEELVGFGVGGQFDQSLINTAPYSHPRGRSEELKSLGCKGLVKRDRSQAVHTCAGATTNHHGL